MGAFDIFFSDDVVFNETRKRTGSPDPRRVLFSEIPSLVEHDIVGEENVECAHVSLVHDLV